MNAEVDGRAMASRFRRDHRLGIQPLGDLVAVIEQTTGIDVAVLDVGPDEHGLTMRDPRYGTVFIGVARTRNPMRQRSTLAHELGHVLFQDWTDGNVGTGSERTASEIRADAFARHFLAPIDGVQALLGAPESVNQSILSAIVQQFLVSPQIATIALHQAGRIETTTKQQWMDLTTPQLATRFGWGDQYQALQADSDRRRAPQRLLARAIRGYEQGALSAQAIATLRGITQEAAERDLREAGIEQVERSIAWARAAELPDVQVDLAALDADLAVPDADTDDQSSPEKGAG